MAGAGKGVMGMDGVVIVVQPGTDGWHATVWEGCFVIFEQGRYSSCAMAVACASAWVRLHRSGVSYRVETLFAADGERA